MNEGFRGEDDVLARAEEELNGMEFAKRMEGAKILTLQPVQPLDRIFKSIRKRDGRIVPFDREKIAAAIFKAARAVGGEDRQLAEELSEAVVKFLAAKKGSGIPSVEEVQDAVEKVLIETGHAKTAKAYILYRDKRTRLREAKSELMDVVQEILVETNRENANISNSPSAKMLQIASAASKRFYLTRLIPEEIASAHREGDLHIHDLDFYAKTLTCVPDFEYTLIRDSHGDVHRVRFAFFNQLFSCNQSQVKQLEGYELLTLSGYQILGRKGWTKIENVMRRRLSPGENLYRIKLRKGLPLHLTGEHKVPVIRGDKELLLSVKDIKKGDRLLLAKQEFDSNYEIPEINSQDVMVIDEVTGYDRYVFDLETTEHWFTVNDYVVHNCVQIPLGRLLKEGFDNGHGYIRPPKRIGSAAALACIILQSSQNDMHGGQAFPFFDRDMAPFVGNASEDEVYQAMEALIYNLNSMHSRAGAQVPFSSINVGTDTSPEGRMITRSLLLAHERGLGRGETPIFPNIIFRVKKDVNFDPGDPNYDLFRLAMRVSAQRLNPTFSFMDSSFNRPYGAEVGYMGCRTRVIGNRHGPEVTEGRGNLSFTTVNLPRVALRAGGDLEAFYDGLEAVMDLAARQLYHRFRIQSRLRVKDMPFLMGQHLYLDSEKLGPEDPILPVIKHGTLSIGFIGLAETLTVLAGAHHGASADARQLGYEIVGFMRRKVDQLAEEYDLNFTLLATPAEGLSGRFVALDRKLFGVIPGVTDKEYYTNSFHVPVDFEITSYDKVAVEGPFHRLTNAGHISYVEISAPPIHNLEAYETLLRHMAACDMGYAGINFPIDECRACGYRGIFPEDCPSCGSSDIRRVRRITGYLSTVDRFNDAKRAELRDRRPHC